MSTAGNDCFNSILRPAEEVDQEEQPSPDFDGGARTPLPPKPPSMNVLIRRAVFGGDVVGLTPDPTHRTRHEGRYRGTVPAAECEPKVTALHGLPTWSR